MSKPPKLNLKAIIAGGNEAPAVEAPATPEVAAAPPTAPMVIPMNGPRPAARTAAPAERAGQGTLKERARQMSLYLEPAVYEQLRELAFTERTKIHPLLIEAIDLLFKKRGLKSVKQLEASGSKDHRITG